MEQVIIIGGGAAGLLCGALTAKNGIKTIIIDHSKMAGKKILSTGNGKCNMTNTALSADKYYCDNTEFVENIINRFGYKDLVGIFEDFGMITRQRDGYVYPYSEQASAVRELLVNECISNDVEFKQECDVEQIIYDDNMYKVKTNIGILYSKYLVVATGGKTFEKSGSDGSGYKLAASLGHNIKRTVPALSALICKEKFYKQIAGVRVKGTVKLLEGEKVLASDKGEIQLTDYGISGIPIFNISRIASYGLKSKKKLYALIDFMPEYDAKELKKIITEQCLNNGKRTVVEQMSFILNKKLSALLLEISGIDKNKELCTINEGEIDRLIRNIKQFRCDIVNVKGFEFAQVTAGGVSVDEIDRDTMESLLHNNLFFAGEVIDVDGICGGYNLHFAWATAYITAQSIINRKKDKYICYD